jgi:hypothetical protein
MVCRKPNTCLKDKGSTASCTTLRIRVIRRQVLSVIASHSQSGRVCGLKRPSANHGTVNILPSAYNFLKIYRISLSSDRKGQNKKYKRLFMPHQTW